MTTPHLNTPLLHLDAVVLARLSATKRYVPSGIRKSLGKLAPSSGSGKSDPVAASLRKLHDLGFADNNHRTPKGEEALRATLGLKQTPTWEEVRHAHLPALGLDLEAGSTKASAILKDGDTILAHIVCKHLKLPELDSLTAVCDALIAQAIALPSGPVTLERIRAHMLATVKPELVDDEHRTSVKRVAKVIGQHVLGEEPKDKIAMISMLSRRWIYTVTQPRGTSTTAKTAAAKTSSPSALDSLHSHGETAPPPIIDPPAVAAPSDTLLTLVREAMPRIGSDGRFGTEKIFVSALWRRIERDNRLPNLSLDHFKRWLVTANREQLVDLVRADLISSMDPKLVKESEILDHGSTFHFVVDRRPKNGAGQGYHAR